MSASELLLVLGRGDGGADADWDWEIAREMNQSWPRRCCLRDASRADGDDERVPVPRIDLAKGAGAAMDGDEDDKGSGVASGVWWRVSLL
jgi:hypothetical protein